MTSEDTPQALSASGITPYSNPLQGLQIGFIGTGVMAEAMLAGMLRQQLISPDQLLLSHPRAARAEQLRATFGVEVSADNAEVARRADLIILAVKPQVLPRVMPELSSEIKPQAVVLSIVAGASSRSLALGLRHPAVVRAMPNTPAQIGQGITVWCCTEAVSKDDRNRVRLVLSALGEELEVQDELQVAMATAVSGTGPTYTLLFIESLVDAAVHLGFPRHLARRLVLSTISGSTAFAAQSGKHVGELRDMVTSPGGTSAEALAALERGRFRTVISDAVWAAFRRTLQLETALAEAVQPTPGEDGPQG